MKQQKPKRKTEQNETTNKTKVEASREQKQRLAGDRKQRLAGGTKPKSKKHIERGGLSWCSRKTWQVEFILVAAL